MSSNAATVGTWLPINAGAMHRNHLNVTIAMRGGHW
jgi:hypothetical protein